MSNIPIDALEDCASQIVKLIEECVSAIKAYSAVIALEGSRQKRQSSIDTVDLFACLNDLCIDARVYDTTHTVDLALGDSTPSKNDRQGFDLNDARYRVVHEIVHPLLINLARCYQVIDTLPQLTNLQQTRQRNNSQMNKPPPPRGMLSIQNYTDVAVFIEFLVCTSILPYLEPDILMSALDRSRHSLPKSLAGRISKCALLWGSANVDKNRDAASTLDELRSTVAVIGNVVMLDRFRPMILPRHLVDLFAAVLQSDELERTAQPQSKSSTTYDAVRIRLFSGPKSIVDPLSHASTYQTLLSKGTRAPLWLRQQVSTLLADLACRDLASIVHVFVQTASSFQEDMTVASARLAYALVVGNHPVMYFKRLSEQLMQLLEVEGPIESAVGNPNMAARSLTVWAVCHQLTAKQLKKYFLPLFGQALLPTSGKDEFSVHRVIRQILILLSMLPPSFDASGVVALFLSAMTFDNKHPSGSKMTILGILVRVATLKSAVRSQAKVDAALTLRLLVATMTHTTFKVSGKTVSGNDLLALALVYTIEPTSWDIRGNQYAVAVARIPSSSFENVDIIEEEYNVIETMDARAKFIVVGLLAPLSQQVNDEPESNKENVSQVASALPSTLFRVLLIIYFSNMKENISGSQNTTCFCSLQNNVRALQANGFHTPFQLSTMLLLPFIGEQCSIGSLLSVDQNGKALLDIMSLIIESAGQVKEDSKHPVFDEKTSHNKDDHFKTSDELLCMLLGISTSVSPVIQEEQDDNALNISTNLILLPVVAVVLSILVAMLELGARNRPHDEESTLQAMVPYLETLSTFDSSLSPDIAEMAICRSEIAEMASHATALILHRIVTTLESSTFKKVQPQLFSDLLEEAENDLQSDQPPIRAKGLIGLRHLARGYLNSEGNNANKVRIVEIDGNHDGDDLSAANQILRVSLHALSDRESYVFLAAIQTIVSVADIQPRVILPLLLVGMSTGVITLSKTCVIKLEPSQRVKIGEAVLFTVRRRGNAINLFTDYFFTYLLYGGVQSKAHKDSVGNNTGLVVQQETHRYFRGESTYTSDSSSREKNMDDTSLRINTGGPVFDIEEDDIVRGTCITVLAELVFAAPVTVTTRYCAELVRLANTLLYLETSRPVRRSASLLCSAIYRCVIQEMEDAIETESWQQLCTDTSFVVSLVRCGEKSLRESIESCIDGYRTDTKVHDPATIARCKEALAIRSEADDLGIFDAAALYIAAVDKDRLDPITQIIRTRLVNDEKDKIVDSMNRLQVDPHDLSFC